MTESRVQGRARGFAVSFAETESCAGRVWRVEEEVLVGQTDSEKG